MGTIDSAGLEVLDEFECERLIASADIGRVALSVGALPAVFPVNFRFVDGRVMFLTGEGTKLRAALSETVVAFEVDWIDPVTHSGWSVQILGIARVSAESKDREAATIAGLRPWAPTYRRHLVTITPERMSGRRLAPDGYWNTAETND